MWEILWTFVINTCQTNEVHKDHNVAQGSCGKPPSDQYCVLLLFDFEQWSGQLDQTYLIFFFFIRISFLNCSRRMFLCKMEHLRNTLCGLEVKR